MKRLWFLLSAALFVGFLWLASGVGEPKVVGLLALVCGLASVTTLAIGADTRSN